MSWRCIDCGADRGNEPSGVCDCPGPRGWGSSSEWVEAPPTPCPRCGGAGIVDTSPPGGDRAPWLATDTQGDA